MARSSLLLIAIFAFVATACGSGDSASGSETASGFIFIDSTGSHICDVMLESYPPQCGEPSVKLLDLIPGSVVALQSSGDAALADVSWIDYTATVAGNREASGLSSVVLSDPVYSSGSEGVVLRVADLGLKDREPVTWPFDLTNRTDTSLTLTFSDGQRVEVTLSDDSGEVYRWSDDLFFTQTIERVDLPAGTTLPYIVRADPIDLPPGEYTAKAWVTAPQAIDGVLTWTLTITS